MQRVSSARSYLRSTVPGGVRRKYTQSAPTPEPAAPKKPAKLTLKGWDDIILPSREEVLAQRKVAEETAKAKAEAAVGLSKSKTDIGYLKFESNASLAARLARPMIDIQERMLSEKQEKAASAGVKAKPEEEPKIDLTKPIKLALSPAEQRRAVRLAREADAERREKAKAEQEEQRRTKAAKAALSQTEQQLQNLNMVAQSLMNPTSPRAPHAPTPLSGQMKLAKESAAKRRAERLARQAGTSQPGPNPKRNRVQTLHKKQSQRPRKEPTERGVNRRTKKQPEEDTFEEPAVLDGMPGYLPELTGPPTYNVDMTPIRQPTLTAPTSRYVPESLSFTTKRVDNLYPPTQLVQMVLSHRVDVSIPKRKHALALVEKMTKGSSLSKTI